MKKSVNPELIVLARESIGITQLELANLIGIDQGNLSKMENGILPLSNEVIENISKKMSFPINYFFENGSTYTPQIHFYRKSKSLPTKELSKIRAKSIIDRLRVEKLLRSVEIQKEYFRYEIEDYDSPEAIANLMRQNWKVSRGSVPNVAELLENNGIIVIPVNFGSRFISDITTITDKGIYIIFLNSNQPPDRKRFTLCHVLGHIIMHNFSSSGTIETEADRFAGEFLMPSNEIRHQLTNLTLSKLADLKRYWKVSMAAILMRADHLGVILPEEKKRLWKKMSAKGYRLNEPPEMSIPDETPELLYNIIDLYKNELHYTDFQMSDFLFLTNDDYNKYNIKYPTLRLIHNNKN